jgi:hypothetical protein
VAPLFHSPVTSTDGCNSSPSNTAQNHIVQSSAVLRLQSPAIGTELFVSRAVRPAIQGWVLVGVCVHTAHNLQLLRLFRGCFVNLAFSDSNRLCVDFALSLCSHELLIPPHPLALLSFCLSSLTHINITSNCSYTLHTPLILLSIAYTATSKYAWWYPSSTGGGLLLADAELHQSRAARLVYGCCHCDIAQPYRHDRQCSSMGKNGHSTQCWH